MNSMNDLSQKKLLHLCHSAFFKLFHIPLDWILPDDRTFTICGKDHCNPLCMKIQEHVEGAKLCNQQTRTRLLQARNTRKAVLDSCHAGFYDLVIPIYDHGEYLGSLCAGQFLIRQDSDIAETAAENLKFMSVSPDELRRYYRETRTFSPEEIDGLQELLQLISDFICDSYGKSKFLASIANSSQVENAEIYIKRHYTQELTIAKLARMTGMSQSYLIHQFTRQNGVSPMQYLTIYRVFKAVDLLKNSKLSIAEVAFAVGFKNVSTFNRSFRKVTGISPSACRRNPELVTLSKHFSTNNQP